MRINLWPKEQQWLVTNRFDGKNRFLCDIHIAEAIKILNQKGYYTCNCCEGHPYMEIPIDNMPVSNSTLKKWKSTLYFEGGYIYFARAEDRDLIIDLLNSKGDYFTKDTHSDWCAAKKTLDWMCISGMFIDGKKHSKMRYSSMEKMARLIYEDIWRIILEVAEELPYKECKERG